MSQPWAIPAALFFATVGSSLGIYAFISPLAAARMHGIELEHSASGSPSSNRAAVHLVTVFGGRNLASGLTMLALYWQQMPKALGTMLLCTVAAGVVDTVVTSRWGTKQKAWGHAIGTTILGLTGWALMK